MKNNILKICIITIIFLFGYNANEKITQVKITEKLNNDLLLYEENRTNLSDEEYFIYKIYDRLIRANNLENKSWQYSIFDLSRTPNAYSLGTRKIIINKLHDLLKNDEDAMAFILAHEIAHHENSTISNKNKMYKNNRELELEFDKKAIEYLAKANYNIYAAQNALIITKKAIYGDTNKNDILNDRLTNVNYAIKRTDIKKQRKKGLKNLYKSNVSYINKSPNSNFIILSQMGNKTDE